MKKEKVFLHFFKYEGKPIQAKREAPFEIRLLARMSLDAICFEYNRLMLEEAINKALVENNKVQFRKLSEQYKEYIWE